MTEQNQPSTTPPAWFRIWSAVAIAGGIVALIGMIALLVPAPAASFGWFAYQPLDQSVFLPSMSLLSPTTIWGALALTVGLLVVAFSAGFLIGRRTRTTASD
ncbi:hypothetical protein [Leifsonia sp. Leaf264]|uniref:hypothetical protein n=1 Tax=Leifsonia sp. Leaf264 TaxID=1736314 RepID=UPI0006F1DAE6|nr:hypothetical protein [Leifsonia sp. Leaf264]KQP01670.1 hypothetical protein ASF30_03560 [Leifsonia sp. Leaf264]